MAKRKKQVPAKDIAAAVETEAAREDTELLVQDPWFGGLLSPAVDPTPVRPSRMSGDEVAGMLRQQRRETRLREKGY